jgi:hypothetical protein
VVGRVSSYGISASVLPNTRPFSSIQTSHEMVVQMVGSRYRGREGYGNPTYLIDIGMRSMRLLASCMMCGGVTKLVGGQYGEERSLLLSIAVRLYGRRE